VFFRIALILLSTNCTIVFAQLGGKSAFTFINQSNSAKVAGLGGYLITKSDNDPNLIINNPAVLNAEMKRNLALSYTPYFAGIFNTNLAYAFQIPQAGMFGVSLQYINYGSATATDVSGASIGTVSANDFCLGATKSHTLGNYSLGITFKYVGSQLANTSAFALMMDLGAFYKHPVRQMTVGLVAKNVGLAIKSYGTNKTALPIDIQLAITYKPPHMPIRFTGTLHHLNKYDITYYDPNYIVSYDYNNQPVYQNISVADKLFSHLSIGAELILGKNLNLMAGYNHLQRTALSTDQYGGLTGFSMGGMLRIKSFEFAYTRSFAAPANSTDYFSLSINFNKKNQKNETVKTEPLPVSPAIP
jgi:hypothetical protein